MGREGVTQSNPAADARFVPVLVNAREVRRADAEAHRGIPKIRLLEADDIALHSSAGRGFKPETLPRAAEGRAVAEIFPACWPAADIEILLVDDNVADQPGVGVYADADHQFAGLRFVSEHIDGQPRFDRDKRLRSAEHLNGLSRCDPFRHDSTRRDIARSDAGGRWLICHSRIAVSRTSTVTRRRILDARSIDIRLT